MLGVGGFLKLALRMSPQLLKSIALCTGGQSDEKTVIVETCLGKLMDSVSNARNGNKVLAFRGIPYAESCSGEQRFKPAEKIKKWNGVLDARNDGPMCPKIIREDNKNGADNNWLSEDCLVMNIFSRNLCGNAPVIFYIHGGAFTGGSCNSQKACGPQYIMEKDLVFVAIHYRLGALGFLCTDTAEAPGNNGLKDQVLALKWVRDNITFFGGDPKNITLMGQSAGGWAVSTHLVSPMSRGLFHKAILLSGSSTSHHYVDNVYWTKKLAIESGCISNDPKELVAHLSTVPWQKFIEISKTWEALNILNIKWNIQIEKDFGQERFLVEHPTESFSNGNFARVPILAGFTKDEFGYFANIIYDNSELLSDVNENFEKYALSFFQIEPSYDALKVGKAIKDFYQCGETITEKNLNGFSNMFSDAKIGHAVHRLVHLVRKYTDIYYYRLDFVGRYSRVYDINGNPLLTGCWHADDLLYFFVTDSNAPQFSHADPENIIVERFMNWLANFAKFGDPNGDQNEDILNSEIRWIPSNAKQVKTLYINHELSIGEEPFQDRFKFWDELFPVK